MKIENIADIADIAEEILKESDGYAKMAIQAPEGLKTHLLEVVDRLEECGKRVILFADPCYGACDLKDHEAKELGAELLVHIGHSEMGVEKELPVIFFHCFMMLMMQKLMKAVIANSPMQLEKEIFHSLFYQFHECCE
jgi:diphthamide biosynthesis enzyme Dph1/Dph2 domain